MRVIHVRATTGRVWVWVIILHLAMLKAEGSGVYACCSF